MESVFKASVVALTVVVAGCGGSGQVSTQADDTGGADRLMPISSMTPFTNQFDDPRLVEVSGVQRSALVEGAYYVHNDANNEPLVYVVDAEAMVLGSIRLVANTDFDWEAIAGARLNGIAHIVVADTGNNSRRRTNLRLQIIEEPDLGALEVGFEIETVSRNVDISYSDGGAYDTEAVFIDGDNDTVVVVAKEGQNTAGQSIWRGSLSSGLTDGTMVLEFLGVVALPDLARANAITDIDIHPDGRQLAILTYGVSGAGQLFIWSAASGEGTVNALTRDANRTLTVPLASDNIQAEGISYSPDGLHLLVAAEARGISTLTVLSATAE